jgi:NAD(P)-dependent dehydrogenase (short-subunit alcohol dehydrogenase family)
MADKAIRIALVTGANRGIGFEVCSQLASRGFVVFLTARDAAKARTAAGKLAKAGNVEPLLLDVADPPSIQNAAAEVKKRYGYLNVLINNAGINYDNWQTAENADIDRTVMETITTNLVGPLAHVPGISAATAGEWGRQNRECVIGIRIARQYGRRSACLSSHESGPQCLDAHACR